MKLFNNLKVLDSFKRLSRLAQLGIVVILVVIFLWGIPTIVSKTRAAKRSVLQDAARFREAAMCLLTEEYLRSDYPATGEIIITQSEIEEFLGKKSKEDIVVVARSVKAHLSSPNIDLTKFIYVDFDNEVVITLENGEFVRHGSY